MRREIVIPYVPRDAQQEIHDLCESTRFGVVVAHRRFGKSVCFANELQRRALSTDRDDWRGAFLGPFYSQTKQIVWDVLRAYSRCIPGVKYNESELRIDYPNGSRIRLYGADSPDTLRGIGLDAAVFDEFDLMLSRIWTEVVRPALVDRGGSAYFIGTFKQIDGPLAELYDYAGDERENWFRRLYRASETGHVDPEELESSKEIMSDEEYAREFECERTSSVQGSIFGPLVDRADAEGRIRNVHHDEALPVTTAWDLGIGDAMALWFLQLAGNEIRCIDYYEHAGEGLAHYAQVLQDKPYTYADHIAPHDIAVRELGTGMSRLEVASSLGIHFRVLPRVSQNARSEVDERIEAARRILPRCYFDRVKCKAGLDALRSWRRTVNARTGVLNSKPLHDWSSHGSDAFTYAAMGITEQRRVERPRANREWVY